VGATAADTQREIDEIRKDVSSAARELRHRFLRATDTRNVSAAVEQHPAALIGIGLGAVGIGGAFAARALIERRRRRTPQERFKRAARDAAENLGERIEQVRESLPSLPFELHLGGRGGDDEAATPIIERSNPSVLKKVLWAGLVAGMMAVGGLVARRASTTIWRSILKEEPPTKEV